MPPSHTLTSSVSTPEPFNASLLDLPIISPDNATQLKLLAELTGTWMFSPDMTTLALVKEDGLHIHETSGLGEIAFLPCERGLDCGFDYSPDGQRLVWSSEDGIVQISEGSNGAVNEGLSGIPDTCCIQIKFSPDGQYLALMDGEQNFNLWDLEENREHITLREAQGVFFSPDGKAVAANHYYA